MWRLEFEFRREVLDQLDMDALPKVLEHLNGLWSYATTEWLKLCIPSEADMTRSRWPIHPLWIALASIDWETPGGPLSRTFAASRAPSEKYLEGRALALVASAAALAGLTDFDVAGDDLVRLAFHALSDKALFLGIGPDQLFAELVAANIRKYNLRMNEQDAPEPEQEPKSANPYYRAKQGL